MITTIQGKRLMVGTKPHDKLEDGFDCEGCDCECHDNGSHFCMECGDFHIG